MITAGTGLTLRCNGNRQLDSDYKQLVLCWTGRQMLADTWFEYNHRTYYLTESGAAAKGWVELDGKWYYFDRNNGDMKRHYH